MEVTTKVNSRPDISGPDDIASLVEAFYKRVYDDEVLRPVFTDVARVNLEDHLPKMNRFWNTVLFGVHSYRGNPMETHYQLNRMQPLHECHFLRWLSLWQMTVDTLFEGPVAERAKASAERINNNIASNLRHQAPTRKDP